MQPIVPFRWSLTRARLPDLAGVVPPAPPWPGYRDDLLGLTARVVAACGDADPVFVGRSLESVFDLLGGLLEGTPRAGAPRLLLVSLGSRLGDRGLCSASLRANLAAAGLEPAALLRRPRPVALVDVVASGETLQRVLRAVRIACRERRLDWPGVRRKLRVVAVRSAPYDLGDLSWRGRLVGLTGRARQVGAPSRLWEWLADQQPKVTAPHPPARWDDPRAARAGREPARLAALRAAADLVAWARQASTRAAFAHALGRPPGWHAGEEPPPARGWPERRRRRGPTLSQLLREEAALPR